MMSKLRTRVAATVAVALVGFPASAMASDEEVLADTDHVQVTREGDWVHHRYKQDLGGKQSRRTHRGQRLGDGGCRFSGSETADPDAFDGPVEERQVAVNIASCVMITELGRPPSDGRAGEQQAAPTEEGLEVASLATSRSAWHKTYFEDPSGLDQTSARTNVSWTFDGSCVTGSWNHVTNYGTFGSWSRVSSNTTKSSGCSGAVTSSRSEFLSQTYCAGFDTRNEYDPNWVSGEGDGTYDMTWSADAWGGCSSVLSFHRTHGYS
jgi:hypothetical protein